MDINKEPTKEENMKSYLPRERATTNKILQT